MGSEEGGWSDIFSFRTHGGLSSPDGEGPDATKPFGALIVGDLGSEGKVYQCLEQEVGYLGSRDRGLSDVKEDDGSAYSVLLHVGDIAYNLDGAMSTSVFWTFSHMHLYVCARA